MSLSGRNLRIIAVAAVVAVAGAGAWFVQQPEQAPREVFTSIKGDKLALDSLRGKVVLVNFWATSCSGCIAEMPELIRTHDKYKAQGLETIAVAMSYDPPDYVSRFTQKNGLPFFVALDADGHLAQTFREVRLTPTTFVLDKQGHIIQRTTGVLDFPKLHALIERELKS
jgi:peroxiredoxin